jgi:hypothetical protein
MTGTEWIALALGVILFVAFGTFGWALSGP